MANTSNEVLVGTWNLHGTDAAASAETMLLGPANLAESAFDPDHRKVVSTENLSTGGKYRSIVKLQMRYEMQDENDPRWAMGTGWLIRPDLLVTAGHCVYDWKQPFRRVVQVKAWIGYQGKSSIETSNVQFRYGKSIAAPAGWLSRPNARNCDVGFVRLERPFEGIVPFTFDNTPMKGNLNLGVVGYPADQSLKGEKGAEMYEEFADVSFDLAASKDHMIEYPISSFAGQSGSPVFRKGMPLVPIGTHVYGVDGYDLVNKGSPIGGVYGNPYTAIIATFDKDYPIVQNKGGIQYRTVPYALPSNATTLMPLGAAPLGIASLSTGHLGAGHVGAGHLGAGHLGAGHIGAGPLGAGHIGTGQLVAGHLGASPLGASPLGASPLGVAHLDVAALDRSFHDLTYSARPIAVGGHENDMGGDAEGFFDVLKSIVKIGGPILQTGVTIASPFLGPVGGPISAIAGTVLSAASKACESALDGQPESDLGVDIQDSEAHASRAILAEAALQTVLSDPDRAQEFGLFDTMKVVYQKTMPGVKRMAPKLLPVVMEPALRIALDALEKSRNGNDPERRISLGQRTHLPPTRGLAESEMPLDPHTQEFLEKLTGPTKPVAGEEGFFETLSDVCHIGLKIAKPLIATVGTGLSTIAGALPEDDMEPTPTEAHLLSLAQRHVMGEAALQAIIKAHPHMDGSEGFFDDLKTGMQKVGRMVLKAAPTVLATAAPIVKALISNQTGSADPTFRQKSVASSNKNKRPSALKPRRSVADFIAAQAPTTYQPGSSYLQHNGGPSKSRHGAATSGRATLISV